MTAVSEAFADAFIAAVGLHGATMPVLRDHPIWRRLSGQALEIARTYERARLHGRTWSEPVEHHTARWLAPWAYEHEAEFNAYALSVNNDGGALLKVWLPAVTAMLAKAREERGTRAAEQGKAAA